MELGNVSFKLFTELSPPCRDPGKGLLTNETKEQTPPGGLEIYISCGQRHGYRSLTSQSALSTQD